jgi:hypothetical protein
MLPYKYSTCQDKYEVKLEVIGRAGVRQSFGKVKIENGNWQKGNWESFQLLVISF